MITIPTTSILEPNSITSHPPFTTKKSYENHPLERLLLQSHLPPQTTTIQKSSKGTEGTKDLKDTKEPKKTKRPESLCLPFSVYPKQILVPIWIRKEQIINNVSIQFDSSPCGSHYREWVKKKTATLSFSNGLDKQRRKPLPRSSLQTIIFWLHQPKKN